MEEGVAVVAMVRQETRASASLASVRTSRNSRSSVICAFFIENPVPLQGERLDYIIFLSDLILEANVVGDEVLLIHFPEVLPWVHFKGSVAALGAVVSGSRQSRRILIGDQREVGYSVLDVP